MISVASHISEEKRIIEPIADLKTIKEIRTLLKNNPRDLLLFDMATQTGLGMKQLLQMKVDDLIDLKIGDSLPNWHSERKTKFEPAMNHRIYGTFRWYLKKTRPSPDDYLFPSRKGSRPLNLSSASHLIKKWFTLVNIKGLPGAKSLQKTWEVFYKSGPWHRGKLVKHVDPPYTLRPVETATVQEKVYKELLRTIISGHIPPGERLFAGEIAKRMRVGHMPAREALHRLEAAGFISAKKKRGMVVTELSKENLNEITKIRLILEPIAARKAALCRSQEVLNHLTALHKEFIKVRRNYEVDRFLSINREFHLSIYRESKMPILLHIIEGLWDRVYPYLHILMREGENYDPRWTIKTHTGMLEGMKSTDPEQVATCLKADLTNAAKALMNMFDRFRKS